MIKSLTPNGNAWNIYLTKSMVQLLQINPEQSKTIFTIKNKILYINKIKDEEIAKLENPLVKNVSKVGCGWGIYLSQSILELIDVNPEVDMVDVAIEEQTLVIKRAS